VRSPLVPWVSPPCGFLVVPHWRRTSLVNRLWHSTDFNPGDLKPKLVSLTNAELDEIEKKAGDIEKLFKDAIPYLSETGGGLSGGLGPDAGGQSENKPTEQYRRPPHTGGPVAVPPMKPGVRQLHGENSEGQTVYWIRIVPDDAVIEEARAVLLALKKQPVVTT
jgi:hypothetical protein